MCTGKPRNAADDRYPMHRYWTGVPDARLTASAAPTRAAARRRRGYREYGRTAAEFDRIGVRIPRG